jgi:aminoglycoside phosphotransferase (APT) family kinase protein
MSNRDLQYADAQRDQIGPMVMHADELEIRDEVVRQLVARDLPELTRAPIRRLTESGSSTVLFRLGDDLLLRFPRQPGGSTTIDKEAHWLPRIAGSLPVRTPEMVTVGQPGFGYQERWSVVRWIDGSTPRTPATSGADAAHFARDLAALLASLRAAEVPVDACADPALHWYRSRPLRGIRDDIDAYIVACRDIAELPLDSAAATRFWQHAMSLPDPPPDASTRWVHTDLLAENLLIRDGRLTAVLDFGGLALGHPSVDLISAWETLGPVEREILRAALGVGDLDWLRGRAWAFAIAIMTFPYYWHSMPQRCGHRLVMAQAVLDDFAVEG